MKRLFLFVTVLGTCALISCNQSNEKSDAVSTDQTVNTSAPSGQSGVQDDVSQRNIVQAAMSSKDHSTLVAAVKQADLVDALSNAGPFTVFAPTNAAFDQLPAGTVENLMKPENKDKLKDILQYHVSVAVLKEDLLQDGQVIGQVNGSNITISKKDGVIMINGKAKILGAIPAANGIIYAIDQVLLPPQ